MFARLSRERNHSTWGRKGGKEKVKGGFRQIWYVSCVCPAACSCLFCLRLCCCQEAEKGGGRRGGLLWDSKGEGSGGRKGRGLALGLFAALSFPLSTLAHLHLCELDVPQHIGVCDGERKGAEVMDVRIKVPSPSASSFGHVVTFRLLYVRKYKACISLVMMELLRGFLHHSNVIHIFQWQKI